MFSSTEIVFGTLYFCILGNVYIFVKSKLHYTFSGFYFVQRTFRFLLQSFVTKCVLKFFESAYLRVVNQELLAKVKNAKKNVMVALSYHADI